MFNQLNQITMETKFTKGEWKVKKLSDKHFEINDESIDVWGGDVIQNRVSEEEAEANAKLIAAAPDLFNALLELVKVLEPNEDWWYIDQLKQAKQAIKKATE